MLIEAQLRVLKGVKKVSISLIAACYVRWVEGGEGRGKKLMFMVIITPLF